MADRSIFLPEFGRYLRSLRRAKEDGLAKDFTQAAVARHVKMSQSLLAQYETGRIGNPDSETLQKLAHAYDVSYLELVHRLMREKYAPKDGWDVDEVSVQQQAIWSAALRRSESAWQGTGEYEADQLRAKALLVERANVLEIQAFANWCKTYKAMRDLWIVVPDFVDQRNQDVFESVASNIKRGVRYVYFVREPDLKPHGRFARLKDELRAKLRYTEKKINESIVAVPLTVDEIAWLNTEYVIANPLQDVHAIASAILRIDDRADTPIVAMKLATVQATDLIRHLQEWIQKKPQAKEVLQPAYMKIARTA